MSFHDARTYLTDDCDDGQETLSVYQGENGDWYITVLDQPTHKLGPTVRLTTSGARRQHQHVMRAVAALYRALGNEEPFPEPVVAPDAERSVVLAPRPAPDLRRITFVERDETRYVGASYVYTCPAEVPNDAVDVPIEAFPDPPLTGPFRVRVRGRKRPVLARLRTDPDPGERVLVLRLGRDLLTLAVGVAQARKEDEG